MSNRSFRFSSDLSSSGNTVLVSASSSRYEGDWSSILHSHSFTELFYVREGKGNFLIGEKAFPIKKDDLIIINPHVRHTEQSDKNQPLSYFTVGVDGICFSFHDHEDFQIFNCRQKNRDLLFYFHSIFQELDEKADGYEQICLNMLESLTIQLKRITDSAFEVMSAKNPSQECAAVKRYLDSNYNQPITLDDLASMSHLNKYYLSHEFVKYYGISPINYLNRKRIEVCKELLETTDHGISDIAHLTGFSSQSYLSQSFRKYCKMSAATYRKLIRQADPAKNITASRESKKTNS